MVDDSLSSLLAVGNTEGSGVFSNAIGHAVNNEFLVDFRLKRHTRQTLKVDFQAQANLT